MNIKAITNDNLISTLQSLVREERRITLELIEHLREVDSRRLYAELGYSSLYEFCLRHLKLSDGATYRRISAMRLMQEVPQARAQLQSGQLSISNAARVQSVFRAEKKKGQKRTPQEKQEIVNQIQGLSQRECDLTLLKLAPEATQVVVQERLRYLSPTQTELRMVLDLDTLNQANRLKDYLSHALPDGNYTDLFARLVKEALTKIEKKLGLVAS